MDAPTNYPDPDVRGVSIEHKQDLNEAEVSKGEPLSQLFRGQATDHPNGIGSSENEDVDIGSGHSGSGEEVDDTSGNGRHSSDEGEYDAEATDSEGSEGRACKSTHFGHIAIGDSGIYLTEDKIKKSDHQDAETSLAGSARGGDLTQSPLAVARSLRITKEVLLSRMRVYEKDAQLPNVPPEHKACANGGDEAGVAVKDTERDFRACRSVFTKEAQLPNSLASRALLTDTPSTSNPQCSVRFVAEFPWQRSAIAFNSPARSAFLWAALDALAPSSRSRASSRSRGYSADKGAGEGAGVDAEKSFEKAEVTVDINILSVDASTGHVVVTAEATPASKRVLDTGPSSFSPSTSPSRAGSFLNIRHESPASSHEDSSEKQKEEALVVVAQRAADLSALAASLSTIGLGLCNVSVLATPSGKDDSTDTATDDAGSQRGEGSSGCDSDKTPGAFLGGEGDLVGQQGLHVQSQATRESSTEVVDTNGKDSEHNSSPEETSIAETDNPTRCLQFSSNGEDDHDSVWEDRVDFLLCSGAESSLDFDSVDTSVFSERNVTSENDVSAIAASPNSARAVEETKSPSDDQEDEQNDQREDHSTLNTHAPNAFEANTSWSDDLEEEQEDQREDDTTLNTHATRTDKMTMSSADCENKTPPGLSQLFDKIISPSSAREGGGSLDCEGRPGFASEGSFQSPESAGGVNPESGEDATFQRFETISHSVVEKCPSPTDAEQSEERAPRNETSASSLFKQIVSPSSGQSDDEADDSVWDLNSSRDNMAEIGHGERSPSRGQKNTTQLTTSPSVDQEDEQQGQRADDTTLNTHAPSEAEVTTPPRNDTQQGTPNRFSVSRLFKMIVSPSSGQSDDEDDTSSDLYSSQGDLTILGADGFATSKDPRGDLDEPEPNPCVSLQSNQQPVRANDDSASRLFETITSPTPARSDGNESSLGLQGNSDFASEGHYPIKKPAGDGMDPERRVEVSPQSFGTTRGAVDMSAPLMESDENKPQELRENNYALNNHAPSVIEATTSWSDDLEDDDDSTLNTHALGAADVTTSASGDQEDEQQDQREDDSTLNKDAPGEAEVTAPPSGDPEDEHHEDDSTLNTHAPGAADVTTSPSGDQEDEQQGQHEDDSTLNKDAPGEAEVTTSPSDDQEDEQQGQHEDGTTLNTHAPGAAEVTTPPSGDQEDEQQGQHEESTSSIRVHTAYEKNTAAQSYPDNWASRFFKLITSPRGAESECDERLEARGDGSTASKRVHSPVEMAASPSTLVGEELKMKSVWNDDSSDSVCPSLPERMFERPPAHQVEVEEVVLSRSVAAVDNGRRFETVCARSEHRPRRKLCESRVASGWSAGKRSEISKRNPWLWVLRLICWTSVLLAGVGVCQYGPLLDHHDQLWSKVSLAAWTPPSIPISVSSILDYQDLLSTSSHAESSIAAWTPPSIPFSVSSVLDYQDQLRSKVSLWISYAERSLAAWTPPSISMSVSSVIDYQDQLRSKVSLWISYAERSLTAWTPPAIPMSVSSMVDYQDQLRSEVSFWASSFAERSLAAWPLLIPTSLVSTTESDTSSAHSLPANEIELEVLEAARDDQESQFGVTTLEWNCKESEEEGEGGSSVVRIECSLSEDMVAEEASEVHPKTGVPREHKGAML